MPHTKPAFEDQLDEENRKIFRSLKSPFDIQAYLDSIPYVGEDLDRSPLLVMRDHQCHCLDGGLLAALALRKIGFGSRLIDLLPQPGTDDDHVLAIFQVDGRYGAVAKSNFVGLRYREPVYASLRELVMSYFDVFYNVEGVKTLRGYTRPLVLDAYDRYQWQTDLAGVKRVVRRLYSMKMIPVVSEAAVGRLNRMDQRSYQAGMLGTNMEGLFKVGSGE